tara:strand:+ start:69 stop:284 length:216 start_codon:yes stop_codon:yes gene_type:complete
MDIKIENNIPLPNRTKFGFLNKLEVGQSFVVPINGSAVNTQNLWRSRFRLRKIECITQRIDENNIRIWRTK